MPPASGCQLAAILYSSPAGGGQLNDRQAARASTRPTRTIDSYWGLLEDWDRSADLDARARRRAPSAFWQTERSSGRAWSAAGGIGL